MFALYFTELKRFNKLHVSLKRQILYNLNSSIIKYSLGRPYSFILIFPLSGGETMYYSDYQRDISSRPL